MEYKEQRLEYLINKEGIEKLKQSSVIIFGLGGVGSFAAESICRSFVGNITLVDFDTISISNINRQIHSNMNTIGLNKTDELYKRFNSINPECNIKIITKKLDEKNIDEFFGEKYDYVIDAIDDMKAKTALIKYCKRNKYKIISSMGMANKMKPEYIRIGKLKNTQVCPIARILRKELKNVDLTVVYSLEHPIRHNNPKPGSTSFTPPVSGLMMASYIVRKLLDYK